MKKIVSLVAAVCALAFVACEQPKDDPQLSVSAKALVFEGVDAPSQEVGVTSNVEWKCTVLGSASSWLTAQKSENGNSIVVSVADNNSAERVGKIVVEPVSAKVQAKEISVTQKEGALTFTVSPEKLEFAGLKAPAQEVTVQLGEGFTWTAEPEEKATWIHVETGEGKFAVTVDDNPSTSPRAARIVVTPSDKALEPKSVTVTQSGKELLPEMIVTPMPYECTFGYNDISEVRYDVQAQLTEWSAATSDGKGELVPWIKIRIVDTDDQSYVSIGVEPNVAPGAPERTGYVVITPEAEGLEPVTITVTQGSPTLSTLDGPVVVEDMEGVTAYVDFWPNVPESDGGDVRPSATWSLYIYGAGLEYDMTGWPYVYRGSGNRFKIDLYSTKIEKNDDDEYYLPDGEYVIAPSVASAADEEEEEEEQPRPEDRFPNTIVGGSDNMGMVDPIFPLGSWYFDTQNDAVAKRAPLKSGKMTVQRTGDEYTLTFDFMDDAGRTITGTCKAKFDIHTSYTPPEPPLGGGGGDEGGVA